MTGLKHLLSPFGHRGQLIWIGYRICDRRRTKQRRFGVYRHLHMIADLEAWTGVHGATSRIGHRALTVFPRVQCLTRRLGLSLARASLFDFRFQLIRWRMLGLRRERIMCTQRFESGITPLLDSLTPAPELFLTRITAVAVDRLAFAAIESAQLLSAESNSLASERTFSTDWWQGLRRALAKISQRFARWSEPAPPPHPLNMALRLGR